MKKFLIIFILCLSIFFVGCEVDFAPVEKPETNEYESYLALAKNRLLELYEGYDLTLYYDEEANEITEIYDRFLETLSTWSLEELKTCDLTTIEAEMNKVLTKEEILSNDLTLLKEEYISNVRAFFSSLNQEDFLVEDYQRVSLYTEEEISIVEEITDIEVLKARSIEEYKNKILEILNSYEIETSTSLEDAFTIISSLVLDDKGSQTGKRVTMTLTCSARVDQSLLFFQDTKRMIKVHGVKEDKLWNYVSVGTTYQITGDLAVYKYQPEITNVTPEDITRVDSPSMEIEPLEIKASDVYNQTYGDMTYYGYLLKIDCYVSLDTRDSSKDIFVFSDSATPTVHIASGRYYAIYSQNYDKYDVLGVMSSYSIGDRIVVYMTLYDTFRDHSKDFYRGYIFSQYMNE